MDVTSSSFPSRQKKHLHTTNYHGFAGKVGSVRVLGVWCSGLYLVVVAQNGRNVQVLLRTLFYSVLNKIQSVSSH